MEKQNANPTVYVVQENSRGDGGSKGKNLGNFPICISDFLVDGSDPSTDWDDGAEEKIFLVRSLQGLIDSDSPKLWGIPYKGFGLYIFTPSA